MKVLGRTKQRVYFGRQPGIGKPVRIVSYLRRKPTATKGEFHGPARWHGQHKDWNAAQESLRNVEGIELV